MSIWTFHESVDAHVRDWREEFVPVAVFIDGSAASFNFLSQSIKEAGQPISDVLGCWGDDSQVSKPSLVQSADVIEIHYVFEDEAPARLHFMTKSQSGLQAGIIIRSGEGRV